MAHFLAEAGYLHLRGVFEPDEMAAMSADMDAAADRYRQGDGNSWWARTADGTDRLVRMQRFQRESATTRDLLADPRLLGLCGPDGLTRDGHRLGKPGTDANLVEALVKPIGVVAGISDVPWHKDCSLGSHSYRCCSLTVGISVTGADARSGQLGVVAGSHRAPHPAGLRPPQPGPAPGRAAHRHRRRDHPPELHPAHEPPAGGSRAPGALHRLLPAQPRRRTVAG